MGTSADGLVLAVNSGSSSLKFGLYAAKNEEEIAVLEGGADGIGQPIGRLRIEDAQNQDPQKKVLLDEKYTLAGQGEALVEIVQAVGRFSKASPVAVGHRVVHGGPHLREHIRITPAVIKTLNESVHFAPVHIPASVALIRKAEELFPDTPQFACFDTAFHATLPAVSFRFGLPTELYRKGVQRFGFHGLSYESIVRRLGPSIPSRTICAHLGNGASLAALRDGRSVDTSMGLTPTGGIPMATRSGDLDPGVLLFLMRTEKLGADDLEKLLNHQSGLIALSNGRSDMRELQDAAARGDGDALLAVNVFAGAVRKFIGAYAAELGGLDLLVFTGGIGEHSSYVRKSILEGMEFLGLNEPSPKVKVMKSEEEVQIANHCRRLLQA
ncbi:MAG TPA: acetate/propionate family kinase [Acidobacteriaceae bacterium]